MTERAILDHQFLIAAYVVTWGVQLSYLAWLAAKWRREKRSARLRNEETGIRG